jgi:hypothetical protein
MVTDLLMYLVMQPVRPEDVTVQAHFPRRA